MPRRRSTPRSNIYRQWIIDNLEQHIPSDWDFRKRGSRVDAIERVTVILQLDTVERFPQAPLRRHVAGFTVVVAVPDNDPDDAIDSVETGLVELLHALDETRDDAGNPILRWTRVTRSVVSERYRAFDIPVEVITTSTPNEEE